MNPIFVSSDKPNVRQKFSVSNENSKNSTIENTQKKKEEVNFIFSLHNCCAFNFAHIDEINEKLFHFPYCHVIVEWKKRQHKKKNKDKIRFHGMEMATEKKKEKM